MSSKPTTPVSLDDLRQRRKERVWREGCAALLAAVRDLPNDPRDLLSAIPSGAHHGRSASLRPIGD